MATDTDTHATYLDRVSGDTAWKPWCTCGATGEPTTGPEARRWCADHLTAVSRSST